MNHIPYTYLITHLPSGRKYYGVRYAKNCHPSDLWTTYFTSSTKIKKLIEQDGVDAFTAIVRKTFENSTSAILWETRVLTKLNIPYNDEYLNTAKNHPLSQEEKEHAMFRKYGAKYTMQVPELREKAKKTLLEKYGVENAAQSEMVKEQKRKTCRERYNVNSSWEIDGVIEKSKTTRLERYGVEWSMQSDEIKEKSKQTQVDKFGDWKLNTDEVKQIRSQNNMEKYGTDNPFKVKGLVAGIMLEKYGVENWFQTEAGKKAITDSWNERTPMECPHCGKSSKAYSNMKRWHYDNCKFKEQK